jgi:23S rRNA pseudouridine2605 synthase
MPNKPMDEPGERLQKVLAHAGIAARRKCEEYITAGRVAVNGRVVTELGTRVHADRDLIEVDGEPIIAKARRLLYYILNKPVGYLSAVSDARGRPTVSSLVPSEERLYPVGRLDLDSEGLMLFTNDGDLAYRLMHPRFEHEKEYLVLLDEPISHEKLDRLERGVRLDEDGRQVFVRARARRLPPGWHWRDEPAPAKGAWLRVFLKEGRKRQIRLMFDALECRVTRLIRVRMASIELGSLEPGKGRWLARTEVLELRQLVGLIPKSVKPSSTTRKGSTSAQEHNRNRRPRRVGQKHRGRNPR